MRCAVKSIIPHAFRFNTKTGQQRENQYAGQQRQPVALATTTAQRRHDGGDGIGKQEVLPRRAAVANTDQLAEVVREPGVRVDAE